MMKVSRRAVLRGVAVTTAGVALASGSAVGASAAPAAPRNSCTMQTLPAPANTYRSDVTAIDPSGRFIVGSAIVREEVDSTPVLLWDRTRLTEFTAPEPGGAPIDVNRDGIVIGNGPAGSTSPPWQYRAGVQTLLPVHDPADQTTVVAINSRGDIAGMGRSPENGWYGLLWPAAQPGTVQVINTPSKWSLIVGLTDNGTIVGTTGMEEPTSWTRTPAGVLHTLTGPADTSGVTVWAASGRWAIGHASAPGQPVALRWDLRTRRHTLLDPQLAFELTDVNTSGTVLGGPLLQRGNTVVTLPSPSDGEPVGGRSLANNGTVAGFHNNRLPGGVRAVRWTGC